MYKKVRLHVKEFTLHKRERSDSMAIALERNTSIIISKGKAQNFFSKLNQNVPNHTFWSNCRNINESISADDIDAMDALIAKRLSDNK